jgi:hypothetical protein
LTERATGRVGALILGRAAGRVPEFIRQGKNRHSRIARSNVSPGIPSMSARSISSVSVTVPPPGCVHQSARQHPQETIADFVAERFVDGAKRIDDEDSTGVSSRFGSGRVNRDTDVFEHQVAVGRTAEHL